MTEPAKRFTLRQLPLPAKLVATLFLLTVGLGYSSAMVQLHFQHTRADGKPMPMVEDVVEIFAGKKWVVPDGSEPPRAVCKLEKLIMGPVKGSPFNGSGSMAPAFFDRCPIYRAALIGRNRQPLDVAGKAKLDAEREGERLALQLWINTPEAERKAAYEADKFVPPVGRAPKSITPQFTHEGNSGYKVKSLLTARCTGCHGKGGEQEQFSLETYEQLAEYMAVPAAPDTIPPGGAWCASDRQISKEKLAQSTHAHLLSFAMLFSLTGLIFAFTSYPLSVRCVLGPLVLLAQVADVSCWWLARLDGPGPYFAMCIIGTGGVVGLGLITQIVLSTFNMYGAKGKLVLGGLFATGLVLGGLVYVKVVRPHLEEERKQAAEKTKAAEQPTEPAPPKSGPQQEPKATSPSKLEKLLTGQFVPKGPFNKDANGGMIRAFFDKDPLYEESMRPEREGEQAAVLAWVKSTPDVRKKAYEEDKFPLPAEFAARPLTAEFRVGDTVKVKSLIDTRCVWCHVAGDPQKPPLTNYEQILVFLAPGTSTPKADNGTPKAPVALGPCRMERALSGPFVAGGPWGAEDGGMVRAFFDKETDFKQALKKMDEDPEGYKALVAEREGERAAVLAWIKAAPEARKRAFEADRFELPPELRGKPLTPEFVTDGASLKVKTVFEARCLTCHTEGSKAPSFESFAEIEKFLAPEPAAAPARVEPPGQPDPKPGAAPIPTDPKPAPADPKERPTPPAAAPDLPTAPPPRPSTKPG